MRIRAWIPADAGKEDADGDLAGAVGRELVRRGWTIGVAESCTGGLLLKRLTDMPGSSAYLAGGIVAYADEVKRSLLGVPEPVLRERGAVSAEVAEAMAESIRARMRTEVGVGVTGIAGPGGAVPGKPVGTVWFGIATPAGVRSECIRFPGDRGEVRERAAQHGLLLLLRTLRPEAAEEGGANPPSPHGYTIEG